MIHEAKKEPQKEHFTTQEDCTKLKTCTKDALVEIVNSNDIQTKDICVFGIQTIDNNICIFKNVIEVSDAAFWYKIEEFDIKSEFSATNMEELIKLARIMLAIKYNSTETAQVIKRASKLNEMSLIPTIKNANNNNNNNDYNSKDNNKKSSNNNLKNNHKEKFSNMKNNLFGFNFKQKLSSKEYHKIYSNETNSRNVDFAIRKRDFKKVVIKKFEYEDLKNGMEELSILLQLQQYDFVVKILDCFKPEMENWTILDLAIVFERLEALPHPSKMSIAKLKNMAKQLLQALEILHEKQKLIHMDIKSNNLMMKTIKSTTQNCNNFDDDENDNFQLKLIDFGLSSPYSEHIKLPRTTGTRGFYAPELEGLVLKKNQ